MYNGIEGYWVEIPTRPSCYYPVEFNFEHLCWTEVVWSPRRGRWDVLCPTRNKYHCNIYQTDIVYCDQWGTIDRAEEESAPAPLEASTEQTTTEGKVGDQPDAKEAQQLQCINVTNYYRFLLLFSPSLNHFF